MRGEGEEKEIGDPRGERWDRLPRPYKYKSGEGGLTRGKNCILLKKELGETRKQEKS